MNEDQMYQYLEDRDFLRLTDRGNIGTCVAENVRKAR